MNRVARSLSAASALLALAGCASSSAYRADYVPATAVSAEVKLPGRVLVYTTRADDERLVTSGATSFTGSGAKLTTPIGMMTREIAYKVFSEAAMEGASLSNELAGAEQYSIVVRPEARDFRYGFPQLKNLGFAITPEVEVSMRVSVLDGSGKILVEKDYASGVVEGKSYMLSGKPNERINQLAHQAIHALLLQAVGDVRTFQRSRAASPAQ